MNQYQYKATNLIAETFDKFDIPYHVVQTQLCEQTLTDVRIKGSSKTVPLHFISTDNDNDVSARIYDLINNIPESKHLAALKACNELNNKTKCLKFVFNRESIQLEFDFPLGCNDACIGTIALETLERASQVLNNELPALMNAVNVQDTTVSKDMALLDKINRLVPLVNTSLADNKQAAMPKSFDQPDSSTKGK